YTTVPITRATVSKAEYVNTIELADDGKDNWQALMELDVKKSKKRKKK
ncbi:MAG: ATP-dependent helicase, partial [Bacteroidia bacterium]|nr:ATP-dependent helicase [Bacteroidia bacterium]